MNDAVLPKICALCREESDAKLLILPAPIPNLAGDIYYGVCETCYSKEAVKYAIVKNLTPEINIQPTVYGFSTKQVMP
ncbi:MAG: hypothetical protein ACE5HR_00010 [bacterium]